MVPHRVLSDGTAGAGFESCSGTALFFLSSQGLQRSSQISNPQIHADFQLNLIHCHFYSTCCAKISVGVFPHPPTPLHLEKMNISILGSHYGKINRPTSAQQHFSLFSPPSFLPLVSAGAWDSDKVSPHTMPHYPPFDTTSSNCIQFFSDSTISVSCIFSHH